MMAIMKAKNSNGEWVDVAGATSITVEMPAQPELYIDNITPIKDEHGNDAYDMTKYVNNGSRFLLIYNAKLITSGTISGSSFRYCYDSNWADYESTCRAKILTNKQSGNVDGFIDYMDTSNDAIFINYSSAGNSFTPSISSYPSGELELDSYLFTQEGYYLSTAVVIYAGIKED